MLTFATHNGYLHNMKKLLLLLNLISGALMAQGNFEVRFPTENSNVPLNGRLLLIIAKKESPEPRFQVRDDYKSAQIFGMDVENWSANQPRYFTGGEYGYPIQSLPDLPSGGLLCTSGFASL